MISFISIAWEEKPETRMRLTIPLLTYAEKDGRQLVAVVMKSDGLNEWTDTRALFDYAYENIERWKPLMYLSQQKGRTEAAWRRAAAETAGLSQESRMQILQSPDKGFGSVCRDADHRCSAGSPDCALYCRCRCENGIGKEAQKKKKKTLRRVWRKWSDKIEVYNTAV